MWMPLCELPLVNKASRLGSSICEVTSAGPYAQDRLHACGHATSLDTRTRLKQKAFCIFCCKNEK